MKTKLILLFLLLNLVTHLQAQGELAINDIFEKYRKQKGAVYVQLSKDVLSGKTGISFYNSLTIDENLVEADEVYNAVIKDIENNGRNNEIRKNGKIKSGVYLLLSGNGVYEYLLFSNKSEKIVVVYLKGGFPPSKLDSELKKTQKPFHTYSREKITTIKKVSYEKTLSAMAVDLRYIFICWQYVCNSTE